MSRVRLRIHGEQGRVSLRVFVDVLNRARLILGDIDSAISENPRGALEWYITDLSAGSAEAEIESRPVMPGADERLGELVGANFVGGLEKIEQGEVMPPYFSDVDLGRVRQIAGKLRREGEVLDVAHLNGQIRSEVTLTAATAAKVTKLLQPRFTAIGSVSGKLEVINVHGPARFNVYDFATKRAVRCNFDRERLDEIAAFLGRGVGVSGIVHRNANGDPIRVDRPEIRALPDRESLPTTRDMIGLVPDLTGELSAEEYVRRLRNG